MSLQQVAVVLTFMQEDQAWIRREGVQVPTFWSQHVTSPVLGDVLRIGGRQFVVMTRVWEHDGAQPLLRLYLGSGHADSDTSFHGLG